MKASILRIVAALGVILSLASCMEFPADHYANCAPGAGGGSYYGGSSGYMSSGMTYGSGYGYGGPGYGGPGYGYGGLGSGCYSNSAVCQVCRQRPCCCSRNQRYPSSVGYGHHDDCPPTRSSSSSHSSSSNDSRWRYSGSVGRGDSKPEGNHSRDWYKERGYDLSKLRKVH